MDTGLREIWYLVIHSGKKHGAQCGMSETRKGKICLKVAAGQATIPVGARNLSKCSCFWSSTELITLTLSDGPKSDGSELDVPRHTSLARAGHQKKVSVVATQGTNVVSADPFNTVQPAVIRSARD